MSCPLSELIRAGDGEYQGIIVDNPWIRILLVRKEDTSTVSLEVEISPCPSDSVTENDLVDVLTSFLSIMQIFLKDGFHLSILSDCCVWSLRKKFDKSVEMDVFDKLASIWCLS